MIKSGVVQLGNMEQKNQNSQDLKKNPVNHDADDQCFVMASICAWGGLALG